MYSRFEPRIGNAMTWIARILATAIAMGIVAIGVRDFFQSEMTSSDLWRAACWCLGAVAFLSIWRFEVIGAALIAFAVLTSVANAPDMTLLVLLLPALLSAGGWLQRAEYRVVSENQREHANTS